MYPEGGGQPTDLGWLISGEKKLKLLMSKNRQNNSTQTQRYSNFQ
jgi:Ser-tRNA(Ala) deacylase AlaX